VEIFVAYMSLLSRVRWRWRVCFPLTWPWIAKNDSMEKAKSIDVLQETVSTI
jgi:hypothetical protein